jgi:hypothetical protein
MSEHQKQFISEIAKSIGDAMDKIKFNGSMSFDECEKVRRQIYDAKSSLSMFADINPATRELEFLSKSADLLEKAVNAVSDNHLI